MNERGRYLPHLTLPAALAICLAVAPLAAQERLVGGVSWAIAPEFQTRIFPRPVGGDSLRVSTASQLTIPLLLRVPLGSRLTIDAAGAYVQSAVELTADSTGGRGGTTTMRRLDGPTDVRVRAMVDVVPQHVIVTLGVNVPSGLVRLDGDRLEAMRVLGAPALDFRTPVLGTGRGTTGGLVLATQVGSWSWALAGSYERRSAYSPLEAQIAGVRATTELRPGATAHLSLGATIPHGGSRVSLTLAGDLYQRDEITLPGTTELPRTTQSYQLGPTITASILNEIGSTRVRDYRFQLVNRFRAPFRDATGQTVASSWGDYAEMSISGVTGTASQVGFAFRFNGRYQTGLAIDETITTAGVAGGGATLGLYIPAGRGFVEPYARGQFDVLDPLTTKRRSIGVSVGLTVGSR